MMSLTSLKKNNRGAGLVSVIIAVAFVAILGSILMSAALTNYKMKQTNMKTKDSFYSAEQALDEVRIGLQGLISEAISTSYLQVLENYAFYDLDTKNDLMESVYFQTIWDHLSVDPITHDEYDVAILSSYLVETAWTGVDKANGHGAILTSDDNQMIAYDDEGVVLKNIKIYFRDQKGYVSMITTDIKLVLPNLQFASTTALTDLTQYSIIADENLTTGSQDTNQIIGNLYAGSVSANGLATSANTTRRLNVVFPQPNTIIVKDAIEISNGNFTTVDNNSLWTKDILANSSIVQLSGVTNVANDLTITGTGTTVSVNGTYNGYGYDLLEAENSSAMLINGKDATLNLTRAGIITLAGHAFIGTKKSNLGSVSGNTVGNGKNIYTGESISIKSNQLMYLVPAECIGVNYTVVDGNINYGKSEYGRNPLVASPSNGAVSPYGNIIQNPDKYALIADSIIPSALGKPLSNYLKYNSGVPQVETIFVQTNGETLVYFYMTFANENAANQFFKDYYAKNAEGITKYADFYTNGITMANPASMVRLQLAGNSMKFDGTNNATSVQENNIDNAATKLAANGLSYSNTFEALCTKLVFNYGELTNLHAIDINDNIVFENIVDKTTMINFLTTNQASCMGAPLTYTFTNGLTKAIITNNEFTEAYLYDDLDSKINLIIATGDVIVDEDFKGLIIADGTITIKDGINVEVASDAVKNALKASAEIDGTIWNVVGFLWDGSEMLNSISGVADDGSSVEMSDLVIYENWTKN